MVAARRVALMLGLLVLLVPRLSEAGRRPFLWAYDTELVAEGDVELEQWLWARGLNPGTPPPPTDYWIWWSPVVGLSSYLELEFPFQIKANTEAVALNSFEVDLRYRLLGRESQDPFQPLVRVAYHQGIQGTQGIPSVSRVDVNLVASYDFSKQLHGVVDLGGRLGLPMLGGDATAPATLMGTYDVGLSYRLGEQSEFKLSGELFGELNLLDLTTAQHHFGGLSVSWTRGRVWLTAGTMIGLTELFPTTPHFMPRLICGVLL